MAPSAVGQGLGALGLTLPIGRRTERFSITALRAAGALTVCRVAE
ncbi:MAG: hypothetical protein R6V84_04395 [Desulfobacterales bacterium]